MIYYKELIKLYDNSWRTGTVAPIAHTMTRAKIGVLVSPNGQLLAAKKIDEVMPIPCTVQSETRTSNIAPHAIHDNITYLSETPGREKRHMDYMAQLRNYLSATDDPLAYAVYRYLSRGTIRMELEPVLRNVQASEGACISFALPGMKTTISESWIEWYTSNLPPNGTCAITGKADYIPDAYPRNIRYASDMSHMFMREGSKSMELNCMENLTAGYTASQKILHVLQSMIWAGEDS